MRDNSKKTPIPISEQDTSRYVAVVAMGKHEYEKASKLEFLVSLLSYPVLGLPIVDIKFLGYVIFSFAINFLFGSITGPIYKWTANKRYSFNDDAKFNTWFGTTYYFPLMGLHILLGIAPVLLFKLIWF